jgi:hypothetical protein
MDWETWMTENIFTISANKHGHKKDASQNDNYKHGLSLFWNGKAKETIQYVANEIEQNSGSTVVFRMYRIWIEQLAILSEWDSLRRLKEHLIARSYENSKEAATWQALRGVIHLELDEKQAVELLMRVLKDRTDNPYCLEFHQMVNFRQATTDSFSQPLLETIKPIEDYFHWQTVARGFLLNQRQKELTRTLYHTSNYFPASPLADEFKYHLHVERSEYAQALQFATALNDRFPENNDYGFFLGYAQFHAQDYKASVKTLAATLEKSMDADPDSLLMLAATHEKISKGDVSNQSHGRSLEYYRRAEVRFREENFPTAEVRCNIERLESEQRAFMGAEFDIEQVQPSQAWLIKLSPRDYFEMQTMDQKEISQIVRPMGDQAKSGDIVFFAAEHPLNPKGPWRITAIYHVLSGPTWSPFYQFETTLELIHRMDAPLEIEVKVRATEVGSGKLSIVAQDEGNLDVYLLEGGAWDVITEAVKQRNEIDGRYENLASTMSVLKRVS